MPERWLSGDVYPAGKVCEGEDVLSPFCSGPRMCVGNHLTDHGMLTNTCVSVFGLTLCDSDEADRGFPGVQVRVSLSSRHGAPSRWEE